MRAHNSPDVQPNQAQGVSSPNPSGLGVRDDVGQQGARCRRGSDSDAPGMGCRQWVIILSSALSGFQFGFDTATINAAIFQMRVVFDFSDDSWQAGLVVAIAVAGAFVGALFTGLVSYRIGRRPLTAIADVLFIFGSVVAACANVLWLEIFARFFVGAGIGISSVVAPMYLAEVSHAQIRGAVIVLNNLFLTGAQFVAAAIGALLVTYTADSVGFRVLFAIGAAPAVLQLVALIWLPESPRWLALRGRMDEAREVAAILKVDIDFTSDEAHGGRKREVLTANDFGAVNRENLNSASNTLTQDACDPSPTEAPETRTLLPQNKPYLSSQKDGFTFFSSIGELCSRRLRRRFVVGMMLQIIQQLSGINTIMYYSSTILKKVGFDNDSAPVILSVPLAFMNGLFTVIGIFVIDRWGRRRLLLGSLVGCFAMTIAMTTIGCLLDAEILSEANHNIKVGGWTFMTALLVYLAFFAPGIGACPWVVNAEIYPNHLRGDAVSLATMANWAANAVVSQLFPILLGQIGTGPTFGLISGFVALGALFVSCFVPETKGVSLEDMDTVF